MNRIYRRLLGCGLGLLLVGLSAGVAVAQEHNAQGYLFFAPGVITSPGSSAASLHFGAGGEGFLHKGIAAGAELGYIAPWEDFGGGIGILSLDGQYHFARGQRVVPFATAGYSLGFRNGHANLFNYGVGANIWMRANKGLRLEFRDHVDSSNHYIDFRIGYAFR
ncbi:MAG TPA: hypothetical protein VLC12_14575 [Terriglobales bacterium]|nr:hypothetical protein [Terriglobales bacterium]